ncbi:hypothetical protein Droror1_Dr00006483 [Drosera rotundifolia]
MQDLVPFVQQLRPHQQNYYSDQQEQQLRCPRCESTNTKFCYYNNYNLSQPRHYCKSCRRYWTKGGSLRMVPVGGGTRKNTSKRSSSKRRSHTLETSKDTVSNVQEPSSAPGLINTEQNGAMVDMDGSFVGSFIHSDAQIGDIIGSNDQEFGLSYWGNDLGNGDVVNGDGIRDGCSGGTS